MVNRRPIIATGEIYHIVIRAVEDLRLFRDRQDYLQMIHDLFEFNDEKPTTSKYRVMRHIAQKRKLTKNDFVNVSIKVIDEKRKVLLEILAFCLMPNHAHLLVRQVKDGGITKFMRKIGTGYGHYYNQKYKRMGHVFQGRYKIVHIKNDKQLITVFVYIHTNPVALTFPNWKEKGIKNFKKAVNYLENYKWSSYPDYLGNKNFLSVTSREFLIQTMGGIKERRGFVNDWLRLKKELADFNKVVIE